MQYQAYRALQIPILIKGYVTCCDDIRKTAWHNELTQHISANSHLNYSDFTTIKGALQIATDLNIKIGRTAITRLIRKKQVRVSIKRQERAVGGESRKGISFVDGKNVEFVYYKS